MLSIQLGRDQRGRPARIMLLAYPSSTVGLGIYPAPIVDPIIGGV